MRPFARATEFVDCRPAPQVSGKPFHLLDLNKDRLPYQENEVDFIYARHVLEGQSIIRSGRARRFHGSPRLAMSKTPSPIAECCRGVDATAPRWQGYLHHRYLLWNDNDVLTITPKLPLIGARLAHRGKVFEDFDGGSLEHLLGVG